MREGPRGRQAESSVPESWPLDSDNAVSQSREKTPVSPSPNKCPSEHGRHEDVSDEQKLRVCHPETPPQQEIPKDVLQEEFNLRWKGDASKNGGQRGKQKYGLLRH